MESEAVPLEKFGPLNTSAPLTDQERYAFATAALAHERGDGCEAAQFCDDFRTDGIDRRFRCAKPGLTSTLGLIGCNGRLYRLAFLCGNCRQAVDVFIFAGGSLGG